VTTDVTFVTGGSHGFKVDSTILASLERHLSVSLGELISQKQGLTFEIKHLSLTIRSY